MASGESLSNFSSDLLTPLWKATAEFQKIKNNSEEIPDKESKSTG